MTTTSMMIRLASCVVLAVAAPQHYMYVPQAPPQHYGVLNPASYAQSVPGYSPSMIPAASGYSPSMIPAGYNPYSPYTPNYNQQPHQFYYGGNPLGQQPQFVFVYPAPGHQLPAPAAPVAPVAPPRDETGDAETVTITATSDDSSEREPLIPGNALSGSNNKGTPEKHVASSIPALLTKAAVQHRPLVTKAAVQHRPLELKREAEASVEETKLQSRMGTVSDVDTRVSAETLGARLRAESRGWRRRLAPNYQSVYLDADDTQDDDDKKKEEDSVVIGNGDSSAGPSVASVKPAAIALAGPGGVASASPVGTAVVGPGGLAVAAPSATAVAGPSGGVPPGALGSGSASARSNLRLHQILESLYAKPARQAVLRAAPSALAFDDDDY